MKLKNQQDFSIPQNFILFFIIICVILTFLPVLNAGFVNFDDDSHLLENLALRSLDYEHIGEMFTQTVNKTYIPLTTLSFAVEHRFFGFDPFVYHLNNLILHVAVTLLVFLFVRWLGLNALGAGAAALVFGVHPMHVESVAWVTERKDVLYSFFYMLSLLSYARYLDIIMGEGTNKKPGSPYFYIVLTTTLGLLSILAKPMAYSLPVILLVVDWYKRRRPSLNMFLEKAPLFLIILGVSLMTYLQHARIPGQKFIEAALVFAWTGVFYLRKFFVPGHHMAIYELPDPVRYSNHAYMVSFLAFLVIVASVFLLRKHRVYIFAVLFYFFSVIALLRYDVGPDLNAVADRFMYLPSVGFCFLLGLAFQKGVAAGKNPAFRAAVLILAFAVVADLGFKANRQARVWKNGLTLWEHQLEYTPNNPTALNNYANVLKKTGPYREAIDDYRKVVRIQSEGLEADIDASVVESMKRVEKLVSLYKNAIANREGFADPHYNLGNLYRDIGKLDPAAEYYKKTIKIDDSYRDAYFSLGNIYQEQGKNVQAVYVFEQALKKYPQDEDVFVTAVMLYNRAIAESEDNGIYVEARDEALKHYNRLVTQKLQSASSYYNLGKLYADSGDIERAIQAYNMALENNPGHAKTLNNLANIYKAGGKTDKAVELYRRAVQSDPRLASAYLNLGNIYGRQGDVEKAREQYRKAVEIEPDNVRGHINLGIMQELSGDTEEAISSYRRAVKIDPDNNQAHYQLGLLYTKRGKNALAESAFKKAVKAEPNDGRSWYNLSVLAFYDKNYADAIRYCDEALIAGHDVPKIYLLALEGYRKGLINPATGGPDKPSGLKGGFDDEEFMDILGK